ncbi:helix-turn-helix domain-containing protein [Vibrio cholerae]|uniref:helix-turn-helix domain-containing protein n=1 Tax=Vibrio cholerae TaxID=666 RepID=UPI000892E633|nr:helix-turn-helix transcriptional regulator [Vibrio cholerae]OFJ35984.1 transcriptional regulator [Vibrio cholerae]
MKEIDTLQQFGKHVKQLRIMKGLSQEQLAFAANLDRTYISGVERGKRNISLLNIIKIANALDIAAHQLVDFKLNEEHS